MNSRSRLLIERDYRLLQDRKPWGIEAHPLVEGKLYEWTAIIHGLRETAWEGGIFRLYIRFSENYNDLPPKVCFHSIPFHPNIHPVTGQPNIDFLTNPQKWNMKFDLLQILVAVQNLLSSPILDEFDVVNDAAANLLLYYPLNYQETVSQCVAASQSLQASESDAKLDLLNTRKLLLDVSTVVSDSDPHQQKQNFEPTGQSKRLQFIQFEDYYKLWNTIATSKTGGYQNYTGRRDSKNDDAFGSAGQTIIKGHNKLTSASKQDAELRRRIDYVQRMKQVYLHGPPVTPLTVNSSRTEMHTDRRPNLSSQSQFEQEVDDLVSWTAQLDV